MGGLFVCTDGGRVRDEVVMCVRAMDLSLEGRARTARE